MSDEDSGLSEGSSALPRRELAAEVYGGGAGGLAPPFSGVLAGLALLGGAVQGEGVAGVEAGELGEEGAPVVAAPVLGLNFCADGDGEELVLEGCISKAKGFADGAGGGGVFVGCEVEVPGGRRVEVSVAEFADVAGEA